MLKYFLRKTFSLWQRLGLHLTPVDYYSPIPDTTKLRHSVWSKRSELIGMDINEVHLLHLLLLFSSDYKAEYDLFPKDSGNHPCEYYVDNGMFGAVDGEILYCMIRHFRPKRLIEIGSGFSTYLISKAIKRNMQEIQDYGCECLSVDPFPSSPMVRNYDGPSKLIRKRVQDIPLSTFLELERNDILFIDSSHVLAIGSDVHFEFLEILPRLQRGVIVHLHDIFLPAEYPKKWVLEKQHFWNEQYLLQAFLAFNDRFEVVWPASYMHLKHPDKLKAAFESYAGEKCWPGSFWIRTRQRGHDDRFDCPPP